MADPVLVPEDVRLAGEMRLERLLQVGDVVGVDALEPFLGTTDAGVARAVPIMARHRPET